ncbi:DUF262 domain-containing protein [Cedecea davisae]|uniref:DUF262 domain-containing protein n=1 Tax=Cedecea davisae TaxID=158484 RepID=UPI00376EE955
MNIIEQLNTEISNGRNEIKTDSLSMSIGEIINLYYEKDIELAPAYQRLFRWKDDQKSRFIESIILGIPLPPIFVAQKEDGTWSVVDGLQRLSTILQLTGVLKEKNEFGQYDNVKKLKLTTTKKLPSLEGLTWDDLTDDIKRLIKRSKLNINIILTENSIQAQYELFQRLNTGGSHLEPQEIRNCLIIMTDNDFYKKINNLKSHPSFDKSLSLKDNKVNIEYPMELILRYFILKHNSISFDKYKIQNALLSDFIDNETLELISDKNFDIDNEISIFKRTFDLLYAHMGDNAFKKLNTEKNQFEGAFNSTSFEAITPGVAKNIDKLEKMDSKEFEELIANIYKEPAFLDYSKRGTKALSRIKGIISFSNEYFSR